VTNQHTNKLTTIMLHEGYALSKCLSYYPTCTIHPVHTNLQRSSCKYMHVCYNIQVHVHLLLVHQHQMFGESQEHQLHQQHLFCVWQERKNFAYTTYRCIYVDSPTLSPAFYMHTYIQSLRHTYTQSIPLHTYTVHLLWVG